MKFWLGAFVLILAATVTEAVASEKGKEKSPQPADAAVTKDLIDDTRQFLKSAKQSMERWDQVPDKISIAIYYSGVRDGALGASLVLLVYALILVRIKKP